MVVSRPDVRGESASVTVFRSAMSMASGHESELQGWCGKRSEYFSG